MVLALCQCVVSQMIWEGKVICISYRRPMVVDAQPQVLCFANILLFANGTSEAVHNKLSVAGVSTNDFVLLVGFVHVYCVAGFHLSTQKASFGVTGLALVGVRRM